MKKSTKVTTKKAPKIEVYTDGSAKGNGTKDAVGGWAYIVLKNGYLDWCGYGGKMNVTNQEMELLAAVYACDYLDSHYTSFDSFTIFSDSAYLINCFKNKWYNKWLENGWLNSKGEPVANQTYWQSLIPYFDDHRFNFVKVKGHSNVKNNNYVDELAQQAARKCKELMNEDSSN